MSTKTSAWIIAGLLACASLEVAFAEQALTAREIVSRAQAAAGGAAWLKADTNIMRGHAELCRDGRRDACTKADHYVMYRVYPTELNQAHAGSGKFRLDAKAGSRVIFQVAFDGKHSYNQNGVVDAARAKAEEGTSFGFSAIRFALGDGFRLERLLDDDVEGRPCHVIRVTDPSGQATLFKIDSNSSEILSGQWQTPRGWHERRYSEFYRVGEQGFLQPGRVRHYYDGVKTVDIHWTSAEIGTPIPDRLFVLP